MTGYPLTFVQYQEAQKATAIYPDNVRLINTDGDTIALYPFFGLSGEIGEVSEKIKKIIRDRGGIIGDVEHVELVKELGDILWYVSACAHELGIPLAVVAQRNIMKLRQRQENNTLQGSGDNR
jgi:NTP pyrophosphatase (non-canonical NTP hydrolase)